MENASKALIIAGSILLSLLIIALGVYIFSQAGNSTNTSQLSALEVSQFNGQFEKYAGNKNGTQVKALLDALITNARDNEGREERPMVTFTDSDGNAVGEMAEDDVQQTDINNFRAMQQAIESSHKYTVTIDGWTDNDLIHDITIEY